MDEFQFILYTILVIQVLMFGVVILSSDLKRMKSRIKRFKNRTILLSRRTIHLFIYHSLKLVPRSRKILLFGADNGNGFRGNPKFIYYEARKYENLKPVWVLKDASEVERVQSLGHPCYHYKSLKGMFYQLRAKVIVHSHSLNNDFNKLLIGGANSVNTWHGVGLKKVWGTNKRTYIYKALNERSKILRFFKMAVARMNIARVNYVISTSERVSSYYPETFMVDKENILQLGQARNDVFFKEMPEEQEIPRYLKSKKIITYMPTHRNNGKRDKSINKLFNFKELNDLCKRNGYLFVIKRHMYSKGSAPTSFSHIVDISHETVDPQLLLKHTDILVTDYSSCYTDYLLLNRPILFYSYDLKEYLRRSNEMYFDFYEVTPGPKIPKFQQLLKELEVVMSGEDYYEKDRERVLDIFYAKNTRKEVAGDQMEYIYENIIYKNKKVNAKENE